MRGPLVLLSTTLLAITGATRGNDDIQPIARAEPVSVEIAPQPAGRRLIRLPSLEFTLQIEPRCEADTRVASVSISVADTRRTYDAAQFDKQPRLETSINIPQRQIGPLSIGQFCIASDDLQEAGQVMRVPDALTAQVSLRCANDAGQSIIYETLALEVRLLCQTVNDDGSNDQESSASMSRF